MSELICPAELSFFSLTERLAQISHQRDRLERLNAVIDWQIFYPVLDRVFPAVAPKGPGGRPAYPRLFLCNILVLQRLYQLSDEATQFQILDCLSFQCFLVLNLADPVPDQNTVREFRDAQNVPRFHRDTLYFSESVNSIRGSRCTGAVPLQVKNCLL